MKLLATFETEPEANDLAAFLQDKGVIIEVETRRTPYGSVGMKYLVSVVLDEQYDDALALMKNPDHVVKYPQDPEQFKQYMESDDAKMFSLDEMMDVIVPVALVLAGLLFVLYVYFKRHS